MILGFRGSVPCGDSHYAWTKITVVVWMPDLQGETLLGGVALLEKCVTVEVGFEVSYMLKSRSFHLLLPMSKDVRTSIIMCLPECCLASHYDDNGLNL